MNIRTDTGRTEPIRRMTLSPITSTRSRQGNNQEPARFPLGQFNWGVCGQFHILDVTTHVLHSEFERFLLTWGGIAEKVCVLAQVRLELALEHGLHLFGNVHTGRFVPLVGRVNEEPQRRRIAGEIPVVADRNIDLLSQVAGIDVNDKL